MRVRVGYLTVWVAVAATSLAGGGCGPPGPVEPETCRWDDATRPGPTPPMPREVVVGGGSPTRFTPYVEGGTVDVVRGFQGGDMITPTLRVEAGGSTEAEVCWLVRFENELEGGGYVEPSFEAPVPFRRVEGHYFSGVQNDLLGFGEPFAGRTLLLDVIVTGPGVMGSQSVSVRLD